MRSRGDIIRNKLMFINRLISHLSCLKVTFRTIILWHTISARRHLMLPTNTHTHMHTFVYSLGTSNIAYYFRRHLSSLSVQHIQTRPASSDRSKTASLKIQSLFTPDFMRCQFGSSQGAQHKI